MIYCFSSLVNMSISATLAAALLLFRLCIPCSLPLLPLAIAGRSAVSAGAFVTVDYRSQG